MHSYVIKYVGALKSDVFIFITKKKALCITVNLQTSHKQTLTHKCFVLHTFTIRGLSINSHENCTVRSCWCRVKSLHIPSACMWKDFAAEIQG
jgi:hypothetical protein